MNELVNAIVAILDADATLMALAPGGAWAPTAPAGTMSPHVSLRFVTSLEDQTFDGTGDVELLQYDIVGISPASGATPGQIAARIHTLINRVPLTLAGGKRHLQTLSVRRVQPPDENLGGVPHTTQGRTYAFWVQ